MFKKFISTILVSILLTTSLMVITPTVLANEEPELIAGMYNNTISGECFESWYQQETTILLEVARDGNGLLQREIVIDSNGKFMADNLGFTLKAGDEINVVDEEGDRRIARMRVADLTNYSVDYDNEKVNGLSDDNKYNNGLIQVKIRNSAQDENDTVLGSGNAVANGSAFTFSIPVLNGGNPYNLGIANESAWIYIFDSRSDGDDASDEENDRTIYVKPSNDVRPPAPAPQTPPATPPVVVTQKSLLSTLLTLKADKNSITPKTLVNLKGRLTDSNGNGLGNKQIRIKIDIRGLATVTTDSKGYFKLKVRPKMLTKFNKKSFYRAVFKGDADYNKSAANSKKILVKK